MTGRGAGPEAGRDERFPKALRLTRRREFLNVQEKGSKVSADVLLGLWMRTPLPVSRVGLTVSSKVGNAVVRARLRRQLREIFRKRRHQLPVGLDLVLIARPSAKDADFGRLTRAFEVIAARLPRGPR